MKYPGLPGILLVSLTERVEGLTVEQAAEVVAVVMELLGEPLQPQPAPYDIEIPDFVNRVAPEEVNRFGVW